MINQIFEISVAMCQLVFHRLWMMDFEMMVYGKYRAGVLYHNIKAVI